LRPTNASTPAIRNTAANDTEKYSGRPRASDGDRWFAVVRIIAAPMQTWQAAHSMFQRAARSVSQNTTKMSATTKAALAVGIAKVMEFMRSPTDAMKTNGRARWLGARIAPSCRHHRRKLSVGR
jgi:hypothetical protein